MPQSIVSYLHMADDKIVFGTNVQYLVLFISMKIINTNANEQTENENVDNVTRCCTMFLLFRNGISSTVIPFRTQFTCVVCVCVYVRVRCAFVFESVGGWKECAHERIYCKLDLISFIDVS